MKSIETEETHGNLRNSIEMKGKPWKLEEPHGNERKSIEMQGNYRNDTKTIAVRGKHINNNPKRRSFKNINIINLITHQSYPSLSMH